MPGLKRYAISLTKDQNDADDLVQDCLLRALQRRDLFRSGTHLRRWMFTILRNLHVDHCRKRKNRRTHLDTVRQQPPRVQDPTQEDWLDVVETTRAMSGLRTKDREIILLSAFSKLSQKQIARRLGLAEGTVRSRLSRARVNLAEACAPSAVEA